MWEINQPHIAQNMQSYVFESFWNNIILRKPDKQPSHIVNFLNKVRKFNIIRLTYL